MFETAGLRIFSIAKIPVHLAFGYFLLIGFVLFMNKLTVGIPFALALTLSVLIHELGHAVVAKRYKLDPSIVLHGFGGYCLHTVADSDREDFWVVVMGPVVEIVFGLLAFGLLLILPNTGVVGLDRFLVSFLTNFAFISVIWGGINLLAPIYPLDGGKLFLLLLRRFVAPEVADKWTLRISMVLLVLGLAAGIYMRQLFIGMVAFFMLMENYNMMQSQRPLIMRGAGKGGAQRITKANPFVEELLSDAQEAFDAQDWREAARLCHQARASSSQIPKKTMEHIWELLGLATEAQGEHEEALNYLKRAPQNAKVKAATERCQAALQAHA